MTLIQILLTVLRDICFNITNVRNPSTKIDTLQLYSGNTLFEGSELVTNCHELKLPASDEKIGNSNFSSNVSKSISLMIFYI